MSFSDETGNVVSGSDIKVAGNWPTEITVNVEFKESDGKTHISITEAGIPLIMKLLLFLIGWCVLLVLCWPVALLAVVVFPLLWLLVLPFRLVALVVRAVVRWVQALIQDATSANV